VPAIAGMLAGMAFTGSYILGTVYLGWPRWCFGIGPQGIGAVGMVVHFAVALGLSRVCAPASAKAQAMVAAMREPEGAGPGVDIERAMDH
jgi:cation/acetate symporter